MTLQRSLPRKLISCHVLLSASPSLVLCTRHDSLDLLNRQDCPLALIRAESGLQKCAHDLTACDVMQIQSTHMSMSLKSHRTRQEILGGPLEFLLDRILDIAVGNLVCSPIVKGIYKAIPGAHLRTEFLQLELHVERQPEIHLSRATHSLGPTCLLDIRPWVNTARSRREVAVGASSHTMLCSCRRTFCCT